MSSSLLSSKGIKNRFSGSGISNAVPTSRWCFECFSLSSFDSADIMKCISFTSTCSEYLAKWGLTLATRHSICSELQEFVTRVQNVLNSVKNHISRSHSRLDPTVSKFLCVCSHVRGCWYVKFTWTIVQLHYLLAWGCKCRHNYLKL